MTSRRRIGSFSCYADKPRATVCNRKIRLMCYANYVMQSSSGDCPV
jgi:hypothetical protein